MDYLIIAGIVGIVGLSLVILWDWIGPGNWWDH
jgi:hypothetical protein